MKKGEATVSSMKTAIFSARAGAVAALLVLAGLLPLPLDAAIDREDAASSGTTVVIASDFPTVVADEDTLDAADDRIPALAHDLPKRADAPVSDVRPAENATSDAEPASERGKDPDQSLWPSKELGIADCVQDWLARANREFQSTIIRRLSTPSAVGGDAIARKLEEVKEEDTAAAAEGQQDAISAAQAKRAAEAEAKHQRELSDAAATAAEQAKAREAERERSIAEAARIDEQRKAADEKRRAEEQKRQDQLRLAEEEKAAKQKAAEDAAAKEAAAKEIATKEAAAAKEREIAERQAAEAAAAKRAAEAKEAEAKQQALREAEAAEQAKAAEEAKRRANEEAAKAAAVQEAEAKAKVAAANEAAEKERAAREAAKKDAEAKQAIASTKHAMVEDADKEETNVADAPSATEQPAGKDQPPAAIPEKKSSSDAENVAREPRHSHARANRVASNHSASARGPVVKRWIRRARQGRCRFAGHKVSLPGRYTVADGDNLWLIALRHYHEGWYFRRIYRANRDIVRNPNLIYPCDRLYLPRR